MDIVISTLCIWASCVAVLLDGRVVDHPVAQTNAGPIQGETLEYPPGRLSRYLGVPYGRPPVGPLRFRPPQPPESWTETINTTSYPHRCYQTTFFDKLFWVWNFHPEISEDCLYLNVYIPLTTGNDKKAVMVWIHGGGLFFGAGSDYPLEALTMAGDVITVSFNYRLDIFGFMSTEDDRAPGNVGFLDQVLALKWVQDNIGTLGGDPNMVTIFGESAGGWSVNALMVSPLSRGLFTRAISQSGSLYGYTLETREERAERTRDLALSLDCPATPEADMLTCLQNVPEVELLESSAKTNYILGSISAATVGGDFLPSQPRRLWDEHQITPGVDYMLGVNSDEATGLLLAYPLDLVKYHLLEGVSREEPFFDLLLGVTAKLAPSLVQHTELITECIKDQYIPDFDDKLRVVRGLLDGISDKLYVAPTLGAADRMAETDQKVYLYYFNQPPTSELDIAFPNIRGCPKLELGAAHTHELLFMFGWPFVDDVPNSWVTDTTDQDKTISRAMVYTRTNFAKTGEMTLILDDGFEVDWPEYDKASESYVEWKHPMTASCLKSRLRPSADTFWNVLLPSLVEKVCKTDASDNCLQATVPLHFTS